MGVVHCVSNLRLIIILNRWLISSPVIRIRRYLTVLLLLVIVVTLVVLLILRIHLAEFLN